LKLKPFRGILTLLQFEDHYLRNAQVRHNLNWQREAAQVLSEMSMRKRLNEVESVNGA